MEPEGMYRLFSRSERIYNVQYTKWIKSYRFPFLILFSCRYIGDGDSKVFLRLINNPPYKDISIEKIEDINHFSKKMLHRLEKTAENLKKTKLGGKFGIGGKGRMTKRW